MITIWKLVVNNQMKSLQILSFLTIFATVFAYSVFVSSQDETPTITPLPTPSSDVWPFPNGMYCNEIELGLGSSWHGITIGESTLDEFEQQLFALSDEYSIIERPNPASLGIVYSVPTEIALENQIPRAVTICTIDNIIASIRVSNTVYPAQPSIFIDDWIANLGTPDAVTWGGSEFSRVVFWFQEGIALDVFVGQPEYGAVFYTIYFPYQDVSGYEARFPYNRTARIPFVGDEVFNPPLPTEQNPFDFDAIIATITAQPSRTSPTATVTP